jgi:hypothetical protein
LKASSWKRISLTELNRKNPTREIKAADFQFFFKLKSQQVEAKGKATVARAGFEYRN